MENARAAETTLFHSFPKLPAELRLMIWQIALVSDMPGRAMFRWKEGTLWSVIRVLIHQNFDPLRFEEIRLPCYHFELPDEVKFAVPLLLVNREAESVAEKYVASEGLRSPRELHDNDDNDNDDGVSNIGNIGKSGLIKGGFDPSCDILLVMDIAAFLQEIRSSTVELEHGMDANPDHHWSAITRIATPPYVFQGKELLENLIMMCRMLRVLYIVVGAPWLNELKQDYRWEAVSAHDAAYVWNSNTGKMEWRAGYSAYGDLDGLIADLEEQAPAMEMTLKGVEKEQFEIRVVDAMQR